jgi:hypothetical protein
VHGHVKAEAYEVSHLDLNLKQDMKKDEGERLVIVEIEISYLDY